MDPNATLRMIQEALESGDYTEARYLKHELLNWLSRGGFEPKWKYPRATKFVRSRSGREKERARRNPSRVFSPDSKRVTQVKNLGWLLSHWKEISSFYVFETHKPLPAPAAMLIAYLRDGRHYETDYASLSVLHSWLDRPVFRGLMVQWDKGGRNITQLEIGSPEYRKFIHGESHLPGLSNPPKTKIYSRTIEIVASKAGMPHKCDAACKRAGHRYRHVFKDKKSGIYGLENGKILIGS